LRVLAIDTTTPRGSVALVDGGEVRGEVRLRTATGHSHSVMPAIAFLLESLGLDAAGLEGFAVTCGPGSFTGLRIGVSTVQGLALASGRPCLGLGTLDVLAARMCGSASTLVPIVDAYRDEVYAAIYDASARLLRGCRAESPAALLAEVPEGAAFFGDGADRYRDLILRLRPGARFPGPLLRPVYLRAAVAPRAGAG
jgi:tRNA threonylcarbamoyladenosine biosynthesis protein TsaB